MATNALWLLTLGSSTAGSDPTPPLPGGVVAPNPGETRWTLGAGGIPIDPQVASGWDLLLVTSLYNNGVPLSFDADSSIEAVVWRGADQSTLFFPEVAWVDATTATLQLGIPGSATATIEPGHYRMRVGITVDGARVLAYDGGLDVLESPAARLYRPPYITATDLEYYYPRLRSFQIYKTDPTGFLAHRADASDQFDRLLIDRYIARPGYVRRRFPDYRPPLGYDRPDPAVSPPTKAELTAWLAAGGYRMDQLGREIIARMAILLILDRQETEAQNPYRDHGKEMQERVNALWIGYKAPVDADLDNIPDWLICTDATFLPAGAAP